MKRVVPVVLKRLGVILSVLWGAGTITFIVIKSIPGDPVTILAGEDATDPAQLEAVRRAYGLDKPAIVQYLLYLGRALTGDFGTSYVYRRPVTAVLGEAMGPTAQLALTAVACALLLAVVNATLTAGRASGLRVTMNALELVILSSPVYWIGILLLALFSFKLGWFPVAGNAGRGALVLPVVTLMLPQMARLTQILRDGLEQTLDQPFALTIRTRGVSETLLRLRHGVRHSTLALATLTGTMLAEVLGGTVITETVFGRSGIGQILLRSITSRDMPLLLGVVMLAALVAVVINLSVDALYLVIDPRLRKQAVS
jgi:peptide/nickel transport system permease protein